MTEQEREVIASLREQGYAVVIFNTEELSGAKPYLVESLLIESGWDVISCLAPDEESDDEN